MKKSLAINSVAAALLGVVISSASHAAPEQIKFEGLITDETCTISADSVGQIIKLGQVTAHSMRGAGATSTAKDFSIKLERCDANTKTKATVTFTGAEDRASAAATGFLQLEQTGFQAKGVAIKLLGGKDGTTSIPINSSLEHALSDGENTFHFKAQYVTTLDDATNPPAPGVVAGAANATAMFNVTYN